MTIDASVMDGNVQTMPDIQTVTFSSTKTCAVCGESLPAARIAAMPSAKFCVPCLNGCGDVPVMRRFDEPRYDGEVQSTFFVNDAAIMRHIRHTTKAVASDEDFYAAVGDDSHLAAERARVCLIGRSLSTAFEPDDEDGMLPV